MHLRGPSNAVSLASTPTIDRLLESELATRIHAHGTWVGLPSDGDMGNSEVGHNALGSGQIISQGAKLVNQAFDSGSLYRSEAWEQVSARGLAGGTVHFLGLLSDGNVHAHIDHLLSMIDHCHQQGIERVRVHCLLDGRDVDPRSALKYVDQLQVSLGRCQRSTTTRLPHCICWRQNGHHHGSVRSRLAHGRTRISTSYPWRGCGCGRCKCRDTAPSMTMTPV